MKNEKFLKLTMLVLIGAFAMSCEESTLNEINADDPVTVVKSSDNNGNPDKESPLTPVIIE
ncbi:MAG: hypothetical protein RIM99_01985 [Cyclobacteriaceae bacterium]